MKKILIALMAALTLFVLASCGETETKTLTCDGCGKDVEVEADSAMEEEWIVFCEDCGDIDV